MKGATFSNPLRRHTRLRKAFSLTLALLLSTAMVGGLVGRVCRDRTVVFQVLGYIPLLPLGVFAFCHALVARGTCLPKVRFGYGALGLVAAILGLTVLWSWPTHRKGVTRANAQDVTILQWNVRWRGPGEMLEPWQDMMSDILRRHADVILLSEGPSASRTQMLLDQLGPGWGQVRWESHPRERYTFRFVALSCWTMHVDAERTITNGRALALTIEAQPRPVRILFVDGESNPLQPRLPRLADITDQTERANSEEAPYDLIVGDFNTSATSVGFDRLRADGWRLASETTGGWRGTYPARLPLYDIDHIWVGPTGEVLQGFRFTNGTADHRGQVIVLRRNPPPSTYPVANDG